jgi:cation transport ATPase
MEKEQQVPNFTFILRLAGILTLILTFICGYRWLLNIEKITPDQLWEKAMSAVISFIVGVGFCSASAVNACKNKWQVFLVVISVGIVLLFFAAFSYFIGWSEQHF